MKEISKKKRLSIMAKSFTMIYIFMSIINWNINIGDWGVVSRSLWVLLSIVLAGVATNYLQKQDEARHN